MDIRLPKNRVNDYSRDAIKSRLNLLSELNGHTLEHLGSSSLEPSLARGNIESMIGFVQVPVGIAGPLRINGKEARGDFFIPLSTTEGALVASYNRGARAITMSGGANVLLYRDMIQRAPLFILEDVFGSGRFVEWFGRNFEKFRSIAASTTRHGRLAGYTTYIQGKIVYIRMDYFTGDAMGMNMITKATHEICEYIKSNFPIIDYVIESNMAVDKKPAAINTILGRGKSVTAEVVFGKKVLSKFFRTTAARIDTAYRQQVTGSQLAGASASNGHVANGIAALFLACGQDLANISESCAGFIYTEAKGDELYVSLNLPSLIIGTIGGGVGLPTQRECLEILGCYGEGKAAKFAEIAAATILAGEVSLAASLVAGDFVTAHEKYGRNRPVYSNRNDPD